ncbi:hypothetical protein SH449x_003860 [Pirellulaceae bacterium SH449]
MKSYQSSFKLVSFRTLRKLLRPAFRMACLGAVLSMTGCAGMNGLSQSLGINSASRVPPPATGSFTVPNSYTNGAPGAGGVSNAVPQGAASESPSLGALQSNSVGSGVAYGDQVLSSVNRIQSRIQDTSNQVRDGVARTADSFNSRVEQAGARVNRIGEGVVQAGSIITDSFEEASNISTPFVPAPVMPAQTHTNSGDFGTPVMQESNATWRDPTTVK